MNAMHLPWFLGSHTPDQDQQDAEHDNDSLT